MASASPGPTWAGFSRRGTSAAVDGNPQNRVLDAFRILVSIVITWAPSSAKDGGVLLSREKLLKAEKLCETSRKRVRGCVRTLASDLSKSRELNCDKGCETLRQDGLVSSEE
jgi:hypothetical protein